MSADNPETPQVVVRRWIWRLGILFVLCTASLIALFVVWRVRLSRRTSRALTAIHAAGYPVSLTELEQKYYPVIPPEKNAAIFFENAFALYPETNVTKLKIPFLEDYQSPKKSELFLPAGLDKTRKLLASNHVALEMLHRLPPATNSRYPINLSWSYAVQLPHLGLLKSSAQLLSLESIIHARDGDTIACADDLDAIFRLSHSLDREPVLLSQLVRSSSQMLIVSSLEYILNSRQLADSQLVNLSRAFHETENPTGFEHALSGELCNGIDFFQMSLTQIQTIAPKLDSDDKPSAPPAALNEGYRVIRLAGFFARDYLFFLDIMQEHLRIARLPFPKKLDEEKSLADRVSQTVTNHVFGYTFSSLMLPGFNRILVKEARLQASINLAQTALAIERYRLANQNSLPEKLSDLTPTWLDSVPLDPFDGKPIRYKKLARGYMVYSVGDDRKDDGGVYAYRPKPGAPSDITFVVER